MEGEEEEGDPAWEMRPIMKDYHHPQEERERVGAERERICESGPFTVAHNCNLGTWETEAGGFSRFEGSLMYTARTDLNKQTKHI